MQEKSREDLLEEIVDDLIGPRSRNALKPSVLRDFLPRLDVSKPNIHDSKSEFVREKTAVENVLKHVDGIIKTFLNEDKNQQHTEMLARLDTAIDQSASRSRRLRIAKSAADLALQNITQTGFFFNSLSVVFEMQTAYGIRLKELKDQEKEYWSVSNRPPNYFARTIALRLARLFAQEKHQKPTFGIASDGNHPSTDYGRALERVYEVLRIKASVRNAAVWAIGQLTDEEINPPLNMLAAFDRKNAASTPTDQGDKKAEIARILAGKGR